LASHTQDDAFHEIQLNGKQLVFLFMAATVVSVVIFLCGVLVGRGVRAERATAAGDTTALNAVTTAETTPQQPPQAAAPLPAGSDPTAATPPPAVDDLTYFNRLEKANQPAEELKPAPARPSAAPAGQTARVTPTPAAKEPASPPAARATPTPAAKEPASPPAARATPTPAAKEPAPTPSAKDQASSAAEPAGQGYALQIAALRDRDEADAIAKRLESKGYAAYVLAPASGTPPVFRVRVGKFKTRRDAETVSAKLQKEEQFNPWITR
jgi:cell division septation protein DedD